MSHNTTNPWNIVALSQLHDIHGQTAEAAYIEDPDRTLPDLQPGFRTLDKDRFRFPYPSFFYVENANRLPNFGNVTWEQQTWWIDNEQENHGLMATLNVPSSRNVQTNADGVPIESEEQDPGVVAQKLVTEHLTQNEKEAARRRGKGSALPSPHANDLGLEQLHVTGSRSASETAAAVDERMSTGSSKNEKASDNGADLTGANPEQATLNHKAIDEAFHLEEKEGLDNKSAEDIANTLGATLKAVTVDEGYKPRANLPPTENQQEEKRVEENPVVTGEIAFVLPRMNHVDDAKNDTSMQVSPAASHTSTISIMDLDINDYTSQRKMYTRNQDITESKDPKQVVIPTTATQRVAHRKTQVATRRENTIRDKRSQAFLDRQDDILAIHNHMLANGPSETNPYIGQAKRFGTASHRPLLVSAYNAAYALAVLRSGDYVEPGLQDMFYLPAEMESDMAESALIRLSANRAVVHAAQDMLEEKQDMKRASTIAHQIDSFHSAAFKEVPDKGSDEGLRGFFRDYFFPSYNTLRGHRNIGEAPIFTADPQTATNNITSIVDRLQDEFDTPQDISTFVNNAKEAMENYMNTSITQSAEPLNVYEMEALEQLAPAYEWFLHNYPALPPEQRYEQQARLINLAQLYRGLTAGAAVPEWAPQILRYEGLKFKATLQALSRQKKS